MFCAVIGDMFSSKTLENRAEIQEKLQSILNIINIKYEKDIASKFIITLGDEFQGLLFHPINAFEITELIQREIFPVRLRFGIGYGEITTKINKEMSIGADGPAYHFAREMIEKIKKSENLRETNKFDVLYKSDKEIDLIINVCIASYKRIEKSFSNRQREIIKVLIEEKLSHRGIAKIFGIGQPAVSTIIEASGYYDYIFALNSLKKYLEKENLWGEQDVK